ncbi:M15 family metallopeptidase [Lachnoclostridium phytofermentans]|uniref:Peptidase M15C domain-containing protein n=1 Tax=Lachnoclostridium phytofermentans (strain ATCC 700394 / DSM 18823 / ISDg) TaxID=357809 RepID=A9KQC6_LACP7|nr:M15 family metallopeptidase [Lachnoclostridium phytofermentans]ABX40435.1 hypothetical protein Cphy_0045 [Lachnoclostridium phytofermentans ISDg]
MIKFYQKPFKMFVVGTMILSLTACNETQDGTKVEVKSNYVVKEVLTSGKTEGNEKLQENNQIGIDETKSTDNSMNGSEMDIELFESSLDDLGSVLKPDSSEVVDMDTVKAINSMPAKSIVKVYTANAATLAECFYAEEISPSLFERMENKSFSEGCTISIDTLSYVRVLHFGFDGEIHIGELIVNKLIKEDVIDIFKELFDERYPIEQMVLIDEFDADDNESMAANNTSSFNYRMVEGTTTLSKHAYGLAIDINPKYNPYVRTINGETIIVPENGAEYEDRTLENEYYIMKDDVCQKAFAKRGFTWGGDWQTSKDYQHFQKVFQ